MAGWWFVWRLYYPICWAHFGNYWNFGLVFIHEPGICVDHVAQSENNETGWSLMRCCIEDVAVLLIVCLEDMLLVFSCHWFWSFVSRGGAVETCGNTVPKVLSLTCSFFALSFISLFMMSYEPWLGGAELIVEICLDLKHIHSSAPMGVSHHIC